ncbi:hypothetical protein D3877_23395 [Azospirillum cavernae]|uniref:Uncharacterized protein n=1 Tax=Azospirillum cavernae TaxID=2320860 RepID=A0A418VP77_9PROT|nr:hypothetical protein D3877_23395 [Azospirillum cavernae]
MRADQAICASRAFFTGRAAAPPFGPDLPPNIFEATKIRETTPWFDFACSFPSLRRTWVRKSSQEMDQ